MKRTLYPLVAGVFTAIPALSFARMVELEEDGSGSGAGLACRFPEDAFTVTINYTPDQYPIVLGDQVANTNAKGKFVGEPVQTGLNARAADIYAMVSCLGGATVLRVTEED